MTAADRVLLTGATGFIGRHCLAALRRRGFEVAAVARSPGPPQPGVVWVAADLTDPAACREVVGQVRPRFLLHAAWYAVPGKFWSSEVNLAWLGAGIALFDAFGRHGGERAVGVGSCAEYAVGDPLFIEDATPVRPETVYGQCKAALALALEAAAACRGFSQAWGRVFTPYGPGEPAEKLLTAVATALLAGRPVACTDGRQKRDFLYVTDVADALAALLASPVEGAVNIASGIGRELREVLDALAAPLGNPHLIGYGQRPRPAQDADSMVADVRRLTGEVGWRPSVGLGDGLARTLAALHPCAAESERHTREADH